jgi:Ca2+-binding EF-hand superfamily protein
MSRGYPAILSSSIAVLLLLMPALAQTANVPAADVLAIRLTAGATMERFVDALRSEFQQLDADGDDRITGDDLALHDAHTAAMMRSMTAVKIMTADLDDDGVVTADELRRKLQYDRRNQAPAPSNAGQSVEQEVARTMAADADKDGRITWQEAVAAVKARPNYSATVASGHGPRLRAMLALASDGKTVRWSDVESAAPAVFRAADSDGNGTISQDELEAYRRTQQEAARKRLSEQRRVERPQPGLDTRQNCLMPKASEAARVVLVSAYESEAVSTVAIGSEDIATETGQIIVEPGAEPLYLVVSSFRPIIWRVSGSTERLERVVLTANNTGPNRGMPGETPLAALTGVPAERVSFLGHNQCLPYFTEAPSTAAAKAIAVVRREAGKEPAVLAAHYAVGTFLVPSGETRTVGSRGPRPSIVIRKTTGSLVIMGGGSVTVETGERDLISELYRFNPAGIVDIDPASVVSSAPVMRYEVMPQQSGLLQLLQSGALARNRSGEFLIKQKIRFPAELFGAHSVKFLLLRGVPKPDGNPGHSTIISEETGESVAFGDRR